MTADVYFNGTHLAHHEGGYSTFRVDLTDISGKKTNLPCPWTTETTTVYIHRKRILRSTEGFTGM